MTSTTTGSAATGDDLIADTEAVVNAAANQEGDQKVA